MTQHFSKNLVRWYQKYGRKDLPWRTNISAYRVWISEIMLQQTQVTTVLPYYHRFIKSFPSIDKLANSPLDAVLAHWSGLGYYARARNLHRTANIIHHQYNNQFPQDLEGLQTLPGIGRSTAGAISSIAFNQSAAILDGNVKRVLSRVQGVEGWPGIPRVAKQLWAAAESLVSKNNAHDYTQAIMDLGALVCTKKNPVCHQCPVNNLCYAFQNEVQNDLPSAKPKIKIPLKKRYFLMITNTKNEVLLEKRAAKGLWGGLWSLPEANNKNELLAHYADHYNLLFEKPRSLTSLKHSFSHYHLQLLPLHVQIKDRDAHRLENENTLWYDIENELKVGLAAPIKTLLLQKEYIHDTYDPLLET